MMGSAAIERASYRRRIERFGIGMFELYLRPERFFKTMLKRSTGEMPWLMIWIIGMSSVIDNLSLRAMIRDATGNGSAVSSMNWAYIWPFVLLAGGISGAIAWWFWGWWYRVRLGFCGAKNVAPNRARLVWAHANFVAAFPMVVWSMVMTLRYDTFYESESVGPLSFTLLVLAAWVMFVGWRGAVSCFPVKRTAALWWFLILPYGMLGMLIAVVVVSIAVATLL